MITPPMSPLSIRPVHRNMIDIVEMIDGMLVAGLQGSQLRRTGCTGRKHSFFDRKTEFGLVSPLRPNGDLHILIELGRQPHQFAD